MRKINGFLKLISSVFMIAFFFGIALGAVEARAESALEEEISDLRQRLQNLEKKISSDASEEEGSVLTFLRGIKVSGHLDTSVNYNFNEPDSKANDLRIFDTDANTLNLDLFELVLEKDAPEGGVGFRLVLDYGDVAESIGSSGLGSTSDEFDLQQAYVSLNAPLGISGLSLNIGKFATLLGYEVIQSKDNFNTSRSFLFGYAIPFTHTGILASYVLNDTLDFNLGVVNGWDNVKDNNDAKTVLGRVGITPYEDLSIGITGIYGAEQDNSNGNKRGVVDVVATWEATDKLTLGLNYDYGYEEDGISEGQSAIWWGKAVYAHYQLMDKWALAARVELFDDEDGARTGTAQQLWEITMTNDYNLYDNLLLRLEYRHDESNKSSFAEKDKTVGAQDTISLEMIYTF